MSVPAEVLRATRVAVTGASGLICRAVAKALTASGAQVLRITRSPASAPDAVHWDPKRGILDASTLAGVDAAVSLAGASVDVRWNESQKHAIRSSRVDSTSLIARTIAALHPPPRVLIAASAVGFYGNRGDEILDESSERGDDFLANVAGEWEAAADPARDAGIRTVHTRFGIVQSRHGGALARMLPPFELGAGGKLGDGTQWMSWIAIDDLVAAIQFAIATPTLAGPINVTSPNPVTNADFAKTLGAVLHRPALATVPAVVLRLMFGELADVGLLASQRALPRVLEHSGFVFRYPALEEALRHVLERKPRATT
jgi:uncharacterized protein (TIGR01777 family)